MRTTLALEEDALELARALARRRRLTLGQAVSELVRLGAQRPLETAERNGFRVVILPPDSPIVTTETVDRLREELP